MIRRLPTTVHGKLPTQNAPVLAAEEKLIRMSSSESLGIPSEAPSSLSPAQRRAEAPTYAAKAAASRPD